jgi:low affinity Fe/Cu permease
MAADGAGLVNLLSILLDVGVVLILLQVIRRQARLRRDMQAKLDEVLRAATTRVDRQGEPAGNLADQPRGRGRRTRSSRRVR